MNDIGYYKSLVSSLKDATNYVATTFDPDFH